MSEEETLDEIKFCLQGEYITKEHEQAIQGLLDLYNKEKKEIEHQKEKMENQKKELAVLNAKQVEFNKLLNTVKSYKGQFKRQQKIINKMAEQLTTPIHNKAWVIKYFEERCK